MDDEDAILNSTVRGLSNERISTPTRESAKAEEMNHRDTKRTKLFARMGEPEIFGQYTAAERRGVCSAPTVADVNQDRNFRLLRGAHSDPPSARVIPVDPSVFALQGRARFSQQGNSGVLARKNGCAAF